jgi:hypothetical protein
MAFMIGFSRVFYAERQKNLTTDERLENLTTETLRKTKSLTTDGIRIVRNRKGQSTAISQPEGRNSLAQGVSPGSR